jgi:hypothetical protein
MDYLPKSREILIMNLAIEKILKVDEWFYKKKKKNESMNFVIYTLQFPYTIHWRDVYLYKFTNY